MPAHRIEVVAAVIEREGRFLVTKRLEGTHLGGMWEFPGGKPEPGETHAQALARELREELGVGIVVGELIMRTFHRYPDRAVMLHFYRASLTDGQPRPIGCAAIRWVTGEELGKLPMPEADRALVETLRAREGG